MSDAKWEEDDDISLFATATMLVKRRRFVVRGAFLGMVLTVAWALIIPTTYVSSASFIPQGADVAKSGLANLAGQFGVSLPAGPGGAQSFSPDFYARLLKSRELLGVIAAETLFVPELDSARVPMLKLLDIKDGDPQLVREKAILKLNRMVSTSVSKFTGVVDVSVTSQWPSVSAEIVNSLVDGVNTFNLRTRQGQAAAERKFIETRLGTAKADLRAAEDALERHLVSNRQALGSPELNFQRERLNRDLLLKQQVFTALTQAYEESRIREVRDTPVITLFEKPTVPSMPRSQGRVRLVGFGVAVGAGLGVLFAFFSSYTDRRSGKARSDAVELLDAMLEAKREVAARWLRLVSRNRASG